MITLDASVVIAHLHSRDANHAAAGELLRSSADDELLIHPLTLAEVLIGGVRAGSGDELLADLDAIGIRPPNPRPGEALRLARLRVETGLRMPDCCVLDTALVSGSALATFDNALARAARKRHLDIVPN